MFAVYITCRNNEGYGVLCWSERLNDFAISRHEGESHFFDNKSDADRQAKRFAEMAEWYNFTATAVSDEYVAGEYKS